MVNGGNPLKRYQIAKVYSRDNPSKGQYRKFHHCDFDIAGQFEVMGHDFEVVKVLTELDELDIGDYEIKLNHRKLLDGMLEICGVPPEKFRTICSSIDKLDKQSFEQISIEMVPAVGVSWDRTSIYYNGAAFKRQQAVSEDPQLWVHESSGLLRPVFRYLEIDPIAWLGLEETGGSSPAKHHIGAVCCPGKTKTQVLVGIVGDDLPRATELVSEFWRSNLKAEFMVNKKVKKLIDRAVDSSIPWMIIEGDEERNGGVVTLKDVEKKRIKKSEQGRWLRSLASV